VPTGRGTWESGMRWQHQSPHAASGRIIAAQCACPHARVGASPLLAWRRGRRWFDENGRSRLPSCSANFQEAGPRRAAPQAATLASSLLSRPPPAPPWGRPVSSYEPTGRLLVFELTLTWAAPLKTPGLWLRGGRPGRDAPSAWYWQVPSALCKVPNILTPQAGDSELEPALPPSVPPCPPDSERCCCYCGQPTRCHTQCR
jgi:hypothetical protein